MNVKSRLKKLEATRRGIGDASNDQAAHMRRCELLLQGRETAEEKESLLRSIWEIENGYHSLWSAAEDAARGKKWRDLTHDERARETLTKMRADRDFLHIEVEHPVIAEADLQEIRRRYDVTT
jgi:hypothetical protein